jgi:hypothetical protein
MIGARCLPVSAIHEGGHYWMECRGYKPTRVLISCVGERLIWYYVWDESTPRVAELHGYNHSWRLWDGRPWRFARKREPWLYRPPRLWRVT